MVMKTGSYCNCFIFPLLSALMNVHELFHFLVFLSQKGGKETILEEELEFKGIEEEEEEESLIDIDRSSAEGDKDKGEERL